tara:strand:- start:5 stop:202 length:198 start_codon:yes stop_codon:yes gene_type:complete
MICIKAEIPQEICETDDELKAIYHSKDSFCIWIFKTKKDRNSLLKKLKECLKMTEKSIIICFMYN